MILGLRGLLSTLGMETYERASCVRGFHVYYTIWHVVNGEELMCEREPSNRRDRYAVAVIKEDEIIGHLPREISRICSLFLLRGGSITCRITGSRRYSADLPQGGVEIPCTLLFEGQGNEIKKVIKLMGRRIRL